MKSKMRENHENYCATAELVIFLCGFMVDIILHIVIGD